MNDKNPDDMTDAEYAEFMSQFQASQFAIEAGYLVVIDGEVMVTDKGLAEIRRQMELAGEIPRRN